MDSPNTYAVSQAVPTPSNLKATVKPTEPNPNVARYPNPECMSQRQSGFDDMCKHHWNRMHMKPKKRKAQEAKKEAKSTRTKIRFAGEAGDALPRSFTWKSNSTIGTVVKKNDVSEEEQDSKDELANKASPTNHAQYKFTTMMPLAKLLEDNANNETGWHRLDECLARGIKPPQSLLCKLEEWEAQTAALEMALLLYYLEFR